jgi:predicted RNA-binding protein
VCEANVYLMKKDGSQELILESVDRVVPSGDSILLENIFSQRKVIKAFIKEMGLVEHRIILEEKK